MSTKNQATEQKQNFDLSILQTGNLIELTQWEEKQNQLVKDNPFIEITDAATYKQAKEHRTALKSGRTELQNQDKTIGSVTSNFRKKTIQITKDLIEITKPHEDKQQAAIDVWEAEIQAAKNKKERENQERIDRIKNYISEREEVLNILIEQMTFEEIEKGHEYFNEIVTSDSNNYDFEEFRILFDDMVDSKKERLKQQTELLKTREVERLENLKKDQQAKINELQLQAINIVDSANTENYINLDKSIKDVLTVTFDFGELKPEFDKMCIDITERLTNKFNQMQEQKEKDAELEQLRQKQLAAEQKEMQLNRVKNVKEGLLDLIHQLDINNYPINKKPIEKALEQTGEGAELVEVQFKEMINEVKTVFNNKLEAISQEEKKEKERLNQLAEERVSLAEGLGLVKNDQTHTWEGYGLKYDVISLTDVESSELLSQEINQAKENDEQQKARVKRLAKDKETLIYDLKQMVEYRNPNNLPLVNEETRELYNGITENLKTWVQDQLKLIEAL